MFQREAILYQAFRVQYLLQNRLYNYLGGKYAHIVYEYSDSGYYVPGLIVQESNYRFLYNMSVASTIESHIYYIEYCKETDQKIAYHNYF